MSDERRPLKDNERQVLDLIYSWNSLTDQGRQTGVLIMTTQAADAVVRHGIARPFAIEHVDGPGDKMRLMFSVAEMERYLHFAAKTVGFTLLLNGGVKTEDGLFVEPLPVNVKPNQVFS